MAVTKEPSATLMKCPKDRPTMASAYTVTEYTNTRKKR